MNHPTMCSKKAEASMRGLWIRFALAFLLVGILFETGCVTDTDSTKTEMQKLQGNWELVYQLQDGQKLPDEQAAKRFNGKMIFNGNKIRYTVQLPGFDLEFVYNLDLSHEPNRIDLELVNPEDNYVTQKFFGIYRLDKDSLQMCYNKSERPVDFNAQAGCSNVLVVLKRGSFSQ